MENPMMDEIPIHEVDSHVPYTSNGLDQCPYCGETQKPTQTVLTEDGNVTTPGGTDYVDTRLYCPDCYTDRKTEIRASENMSLGAF